MKHRVNIRGVMIPNDYKFYYDFFGMDATCPADVQKVIDAVQPGDEIEVYINSGGGVIDVTPERRKREDIYHWGGVQRGINYGNGRILRNGSDGADDGPLCVYGSKRKSQHNGTYSRGVTDSR